MRSSYNILLTKLANLSYVFIPSLQKPGRKSKLLNDRLSRCTNYEHEN